MNILDKYAEEIMKLVWPIVYILIGMIIYEIIKNIVDRAEKKNTSKRHQAKRAKTISRLVLNIFKYTIIVVTFVAILANFGVNVKSILAGLGITAALVGLAFQDLAKDLIAGISIILEDQYEIGDTIEVNGFTGEVVALGLRTTRIKNFKGQTLIIANHTITEIINYNLAPNTAIVDISVAYEEDLEKVEKTLDNLNTTLRKKYPKIKKNLVVLGVDELDASSVNYKVALETTTSEYFTVQRILRKEIKQAFDKANIKIPYPQIEVHNGK